MIALLNANILLVTIALLIGLVAGWWIWRRPPASDHALPARQETDRIETPPPARVRHQAVTAKPRPTKPKSAKSPVKPARQTPRPRPSPANPIKDAANEDYGLMSQGATAASDVAGQMLGLAVHDELPGTGVAPDNLTMLKGVGPKLIALLRENGITRFEQLAALSGNEIAILDSKLGPFQGRLTRDRLVEQASYLARGDVEGFEALFGKLGG